jgi:adenylate cyclase
VGRELGARYVVEGSVRKLGNRIRVTAQLIDSQTGTHVWAQKYDKTLAEIFDVQDDITTNIAAALGDAILLDASSEACQSRPENLTAWQLTARADRLQNDISDAEKSLQYLEKALELDPEYALAHAVLGRSFSWIGLFGGDRVNLGPDNFQRAEEHSKRALQLAGNDPKVLSYVAITMLWTGHPEDALPVAKRGYEMSPTYSQGIIYYADILIHNGRSEEALPLIARATPLPSGPGSLDVQGD